jgi:hypothetical protein
MGDEQDSEQLHLEVGEFEFRDVLRERFPHPLQQVIMPVLALHEGEVDVRGTAFSLGRDLALTATHVVEQGAAVDEVALLHVQVGPVAGTAHATLLPVEQVTAHPEQTDIAVLRVDPPRDRNGKPFQLQPLRVGAAPPAIDERCVILGYTHERRMVSRDEVLMMQPHLHVSDGTVVDHYLNGAALCRFPCFQIDGRADHQMSGGPVMSAAPDGKLVVRGIVSTGVEVMAEDRPLSFASITMPALALDPLTDSGRGPEPTFLYDLATEGWIPVVDLERVDFDRTDPDYPRIGMA